MPDDCIFCKIANKTIPVPPVYEDDEFFAFNDLNPQAPVHVLLVPKTHFTDILDIDDAALLGRGLKAVGAVAQALGLSTNGFRVVTNTGSYGGQSVFHLHFHLLGGRPMGWPPG